MAEFIVENAWIIILVSVLILLWTLWFTYEIKNAIEIPEDFEEEFSKLNKEVKDE